MLSTLKLPNSCTFRLWQGVNISVKVSTALHFDVNIENGIPQLLDFLAAILLSRKMQAWQMSANFLYNIRDTKLKMLWTYINKNYKIVSRMGIAETEVNLKITLVLILQDVEKTFLIQGWCFIRCFLISNYKLMKVCWIYSLIQKCLLEIKEENKFCFQAVRREAVKYSCFLLLHFEE